MARPSPRSVVLPTLADEPEEMNTICVCGRKASTTMCIDERGRRVLDGEHVLIGGNDRHRAVGPRRCCCDDDGGASEAPGPFGQERWRHRC